MAECKTLSCPNEALQRDHEYCDACYDRLRGDPIVRPAHYNMGRIEVIDAIEDWKLPYHLGNVVKYVARAGRKDPAKKIEDLKKARWYLDRQITLEEVEDEKAKQRVGPPPPPMANTLAPKAG